MAKHFPLAVLPALAWFFLAEPAAAYIGPGTGLGALGSILSFLGVVFLLIVGFFWYPIKRMVAKFRKPKPSGETPPTDQP
ncbi:hypothetical protein [Thalassovita aquimarina]|uniref:hypothetical protein n=1 Tax=Thalassovita aquimarina TaxID=2785917 RepID=UPI001FE68AC0|nr:hypothetical protein [Thalassovita aquimarina]